MLRVNTLTGFGGKRSAGGGADADATAYLTASGNDGDATISAAAHTFAAALKTALIWTKINALYVSAGGTAAKHKWNFRDPRDLDAAFRLVFTGGWTHNANGMTGGSYPCYGDTKLTPDGLLTLNDTHLAVNCRTTGGGAESMDEIGAQGSGNDKVMHLKVRDGGNARSTAYQASLGGDTISVANADGKGFYVSSVTSNTSHVLYMNGSSIGSDSSVNAAGSLPQFPFFIGDVNFQGSALGNTSNRNLTIISIGAGLTAQNVTDYYAAVLAFETALSRNV